MKKNLFYRHIIAILKKEFIQLKRDIITLRMIITIPIFQLLLFGFAINSDPKNLPTAILSYDNSILARNIVTGLKNSGYFAITHEVSSEKQAKLLLQKGIVHFVVTIPENFNRNLINGSFSKILIEADATDPIAISGALGAIHQTIDNSISKDSYGSITKIHLNQPPYQIITHRLYNPEILSRYNIIPGLISVVLTMTCVMMTALSLTKERERGTMENLMSMPINPIEVMMGKITPYIIIGYIQAGIILITSYFIFKVPILGSIFLLFACLLIFIICNLALGFTISTYAQNQMQAMQLSVFILLPSILLSGFMFPFKGMPQWAQIIGMVIPSTYFIRIVRGIMLKGCNFFEIIPHIWPLLVFMVIITLIAIKLYKKTLD